MWHLIIALFMAGSFSMQSTTKTENLTGMSLAGYDNNENRDPKGGDKGDIRPPIPKPKPLKRTA